MSGEINLIEILLHSGWVIKIVILLLLLGSIFSWAIIFKKHKLNVEIKKNNSKFIEFYKSSRNLMDVLDQTKKLPFSPFAVMFNQGYGEFLKIYESLTSGGKKGGKAKEYFTHFGMGTVERGLKKGVNQSNERLDSLLSVLASIGSISPFVGLLGTVWGIINSFTGLSTGGTSIEAVAPGIAEALVATAIGLAAAIPAVWFFNYFNNENQKMNSQMESFGQDFLNLIERSLIVEN